ncbi:hypothetical protein CLPU_38c00030 [Gottschalkia purinilytica]|uniref:Phage protein n=1 Tax=Gottschalkia purinilytica TaxID=1503 RepID=A0A0L0W638_GOTPU|nr:hypothetical protein [Gottschalkia purinilytica]KNF06983.1 hypothetical protein CLPU_38c00030 [Gottschalkia purinilytica]
MLEITLRIDKKDKTFNQDFISARMLRKTLELSKEVSKGELYEKEIDNIVKYLVELYGNQFTFDELYDGFPASELVDKVIKDMNKVVGKLDEKLEDMPVDSKN